LETPAIENLHSTWITNEILAMQRLSDFILLENKVLESLLKNKIGAVFNLTEPGEHAFCGCGLLESTGFPYTPEKLMEVGSILNNTLLVTVIFLFNL
jgi:protein tyrosine phosphatase domain-containing protein 1